MNYLEVDFIPRDSERKKKASFMFFFIRENGVDALRALVTAVAASGRARSKAFLRPQFVTSFMGGEYMG